MRVLIIGCGYVGLAVGARLAQLGHAVFGLRRTASATRDLEEARIIPLIGDITDPGVLEKLVGPFDWVVNTVSSTKGGPEEYRAVYLEGTRHLVEWLNGSGLQKYVYTSSTSVYGQTDGSTVDEQSPTEPASETSRVLVETETLLREAARVQNFPAVILRSSGIYGPERGHLFQQYLKGEAVISGRGERLLNMIHRDDLAGAVVAALECGRPGHVYNASDDEPVSQLEFFTWLSQTLRRPLPPFAAEGSASSRKRGLTNKRISNRKLRTALGYTLQYPTYREGYGSEIARLGLVAK